MYIFSSINIKFLGKWISTSVNIFENIILEMFLVDIILSLKVFYLIICVQNLMLDFQLNLFNGVEHSTWISSFSGGISRIQKKYIAKYIYITMTINMSIYVKKKFADN